MASPRVKTFAPCLTNKTSAICSLLLALVGAELTIATTRASALEVDHLTVASEERASLPASESEGMPPDSTSPPVAAAGPVIVTNTLTIHPSGMLDMRDNNLVVRQTPYATILGYVVSGFLNGPNGYWDGPRINSSIAANDPQGLTAVGIINNAEAQYSTFEGVALGPVAEVLVKYTYYGDADLDGVVTIADAELFGNGVGWYHGDFNYDNVLDATDVSLFNLGFSHWNPGQQLPEMQIPEPGTISLLAAAAVFVQNRRRRVM